MDNFLQQLSYNYDDVGDDEEGNNLAVADLCFVAWGGASKISRGHREFQGGTKFNNLVSL